MTGCWWKFNSFQVSVSNWKTSAQTSKINKRIKWCIIENLLEMVSKRQKNWFKTWFLLRFVYLNCIVKWLFWWIYPTCILVSFWTLQLCNQKEHCNSVIITCGLKTEIHYWEKRYIGFPRCKSCNKTIVVMTESGNCFMIKLITLILPLWDLASVCVSEI